MTTVIAAELGRIPMSPFLTATLTRAADYATSHAHREVSLEHLLLALAEDPEASIVLKSSNVDIVRLLSDAAGLLARVSLHLEPGQNVAISQDLKRILEAAAAAAQQGRRREINGAIVLAAIVGDGKSAAAHLLRDQGLTFEEAIRALQRASAVPRPPSPATPAPGPSASNAGRPATTDEILASARERIETRSMPQHQNSYDETPAAASAPVASDSDTPSRFGVPPASESVGPIADTEDLFEPAPPAPEPALAPYAAPSAPHPFAEDHHAPAAPVAYPQAAPEPMQRTQWSPAPAPRPAVPAPAPAAPYGYPAARPPAPPPLPPFPPAAPPSPYLPPVASPAPYGEPAAYARRPEPAAPPEQRRRTGTGPLSGTWPLVEAGQLVENIPRRMRLGVPVVVEARVARANVKAIAEGLQGGGAAYRHEVMVTKAMSVRLRAPDGGFWIETRSPETQWIENVLGIVSDDYASWRWTVTARARGRRQLQLIVSARTVGTDGLAAETALPDQVIEVKVGINYARTAARWAGWLTAAAVGGAIARFGENAFDIGRVIVTRLMTG